MKKDYKIFIKHILESIQIIENYLKDKNKQDFLDSQLIQDGITRRIEIIGEAVKNIPEEIKKLQPDIPWKEIAGMLDVIIHKYFGIDLDLTWQVIEKDLPSLKVKLNNLLKT